MDKTTKKQIVQWGLSVRESIFDLLLKYEELEDHFSVDDLTGACALSSLALFNKLKQAKIPSKLSIGKFKGVKGEHVWVNYLNDNYPKIIDVTATQFSFKREVHITHSDNKKYIYYNPQPKLRDYLKMWDMQNPFLYKIKWQDNFCSIDLSPVGKNLIFK